MLLNIRKTAIIVGAAIPISYERRKRICIAWFATEAQAEAAAEIVRSSFSRRRLGRSKGYDEKIDGVTISFAVTY